MALLKNIFMVFASALVLTGCFQSSTLSWEESVVLPDDRIVVLKREQHFDNRGYVSAHSFEFRNPATNQVVKWKTDGLFRLVALFLAKDVPHILVGPRFGGDEEFLGCPYPSMLIYKFNGIDWQQVPYASNPLREVFNNTTMDPKLDRQYIEANRFRLGSGQIRVQSNPSNQHYYGLNLDKFPKQVFQCPERKKIDLQ